VAQDRFPVRSWEISPESTLVGALVRRPDYKAALLRVESGRAQTFAAWAQHLPTLSASGAYTWTNFRFPLYSRWNAGVTVSVPIFQGFSIDAQVEQAQANTRMASASVDALKESIRLEVEQAFTALREMEESIVATQKLVEQAQLGLTLAERSVYIQAVFARTGAYVRLLKAAGTLNDLYPDQR
jgi:outer membrane protein TolC